MEDETEEIINIFRGFAKYFKKAADILEADNQKPLEERVTLEKLEKHPKPFVKDKLQVPDWM